MHLLSLAGRRTARTCRRAPVDAPSRPVASVPTVRALPFTYVRTELVSGPVRASTEVSRFAREGRHTRHRSVDRFAASKCSAGGGGTGSRPRQWSGNADPVKCGSSPATRTPDKIFARVRGIHESGCRSDCIGEVFGHGYGWRLWAKPRGGLAVRRLCRASLAMYTLHAARPATTERCAACWSCCLASARNPACADRSVDD